MARELLHILNPLRNTRLRRCSTNTAPEIDGLTCYLALEGAQEELVGVARTEEIKTGPVDRRKGGWEGVIAVPEEGGRVGEVAERECLCQIVIYQVELSGRDVPDLIPSQLIFLKCLQGRWTVAYPVPLTLK